MMNAEWQRKTGYGQGIDHSSLVIRYLCAAAAVAVFLAASPARADVLKLKDGQKISGTIVGFENGMFRVETEYGYLMVRRDKVSSIELTASKPKEATQPAAAPKSDKLNAEPQDSVRHNEGGSSQVATPAPATSAPQVKKKEALPAGTTSPETSSHASAPLQPPPKPAAPPPKPVSRPLNEPLPAHIDEHMDGNTYVNDTFHFEMYKPPDWTIYEELHREKVSAIVALASEDEQTVLFVDRQVWSGTPDLKNEGVEAKLRQTYENYKVLSESDTQVDGRPAVRRGFDGVLDGTEWHGIAVHVAEGSTVYGIIGLTSAETFEFQESLFNKIVKSFHFLPAAATNFSIRIKPRSP